MEQTIAAVATPLGRGGISVIRISGADAILIADKIFRSRVRLSEVKSHTINYGYVFDGEEDIDQVLASVMHAPKTYTGENTVEINCHGGIAVTKRVLEAVIKAGARLAEPGEFTKRAFLNGKIDLSRAEAVIDIINADNALAGKNALSQLKGKLYEEISGARSRIIDLSAKMQVAIDYPDEDLEDITPNQIIETLEECRRTISTILKNSENGGIIKDGIKTAIVGKPNVGKSSLLNCLSKSDRAIVTDIAGTTRDTIEERISLGGVPINLIDTAGIRETSDAVEKIGVEKSRKSIDEAELLLVMLDAASGIDDEDLEILEQTKDKNRIVILNKIDIKSGELSGIPADTVEISAKTGEGADKLSEIIKEKYNIGEIQSADFNAVTNVRQKSALERALSAIERAIDIMQSGEPQDLATLDIYEAADSLGEITGETVSDDIVTAIFHNFCVGK